jgi:DNA-directed RNA polymerase specialized sigma24 family protein
MLDDETLAAFVPNAKDEGKLMHKLVSLKARSWKRDCARCRFNTCAILDDFDDSTDERQAGVVVVDPKDSRETLYSLVLAEEILAHIKDEQTRGFFVDHFFLGRSIDEIAEEAGLKANSVRRRILREVERLQAIFIPPPLGDEA